MLKDELMEVEVAWLIHSLHCTPSAEIYTGLLKEGYLCEYISTDILGTHLYFELQ